MGDELPKFEIGIENQKGEIEWFTKRNTSNGKK